MSFHRLRLIYGEVQDQYPSIKRDNKADGRRKCRLRVLERFWGLTPQERAALNAETPNFDPHASYITDEDPFDKDDNDSPTGAPSLGIIIRTDFSNDAAWKTFYNTLLESEKDFTEPEPQTTASTSQDVDMTDASAPPLSTSTEDAASDTDSEEPEALAFFTVFPENPRDYPHFTGISNLTALRIFNDATVRPAPSPPQGLKRISPGNRLVDLERMQEVYTGKTLWIYDAKSNTDQCARLVSGQGDMYNTASGDSWRARASHITELQVNLTSGAMKIDFGGLDRWDYSERRRNMEEASQPIIFSSDIWYRAI